jgi:hypothetical protein
VKITFEGSICRIEGLNAEVIGADPAGSAAAARNDAFAYTETRIQSVSSGDGTSPTPEEIGAIPQSARGQPFGVADLGEDGKLFVNQRPPHPTAQQVGAIPQSEKSAPWGVATLGGDGKLWQDQRPPNPSAQDIGAIPQSARGQSWGLAELGGDGKLWESQRPPPPSAQQVGAIPAGDRGKAWGVAELGGDGKVLASQLPNFQAMLEPLYPTSHVIMWGFGKVLVGNPFGPGQISTNSQLNRYATQTPAQIGDEVEVSFLLKAGVYRLDVLGMKNNQQGIYKLFIDTFQLGPDIDRYAATAGPFTSTFNFEVFRTDIQKIRTKVVGRNASSVGFQLWISAILIYPIL